MPVTAGREPRGADSEAGVASRHRRHARADGGAARTTSIGDQVATREAYGSALAKLGDADARVVALDADVKNSTFSDKFEKVLPGSLLPELHRRAGDDRLRDGAGGARRDPVPVHLCRAS